MPSPTSVRRGWRAIVAPIGASPASRSAPFDSESALELNRRGLTRNISRVTNWLFLVILCSTLGIVGTIAFTLTTIRVDSKCLAARGIGDVLLGAGTLSSGRSPSSS